MDGIGTRVDSPSSIVLDNPSPLYVHRYLGGYGQDSGRLNLNLENPTDVEQVSVVFDSVPWFLRVFMHTMEIWHGERLRNGGKLQRRTILLCLPPG